MKRFYSLIWFLFSCIALVPAALAQTKVMVSENQVQIAINKDILFFEDKEHTQSITDMMQLPDSNWKKNQKEQVNFGYSNSTYWLKFSLRNSSFKELDRFLEIEYPVLDYIDIYLTSNGQILSFASMGDKLNFHKRIIENRHFLFPFSLPPETENELYIKVKSASSVQVPITLWDPLEYHEIEQSRLLFHGLYFGITFVMVLYNLFVYMAVKEKSYLFYVACISSMALFLASLKGLSFQYLWPSATRWNDQSIVFFLNGVLFFGVLFTTRFLSLSTSPHQRLHQITQVTAVAAGIFMAASTVLSYRSMIQPTIFLALIICTFLLFVGILRSFEGSISARYFTVAWTAMLGGGLVLALNKLTLLPQNFITENATQIGSAMEIILLSIALADRLNHEKKKSFKAQKEALIHERDARIAQEKTILVQKEANEMLERKVQERTTELEKVNKKLVELSATDPLTGLKNRGFFDDNFQHAYAAAFRYKRPLSLLIIDIDHFKQFNDNHGHSIGDECLVMVTQCIKSITSRPEDITARYGGEEFVVLLPETDLEGARNVAEKIRKEVAKSPFLVAEHTLKVTVSIGVASESPNNTDGKTAFFDRADEALYQAKNSGRNRVCDSVQMTGR